MRKARPLRTLLLLVVALLPVLVTGVAASSAAAAPDPVAPRGEVQLTSRTFEIARQLRCPVCVSESVGDSSSRVAIEMRQQIQEQLEAGRSEREILAFFQERYGDWILLEPPRSGVHLLVWLLPAVAALAGASGLAWLVVGWTRASRRTVDASDADLARVRAAVGPGPGGEHEAAQDGPRDGDVREGTG